MKFIVDAQLPKYLSDFLSSMGHDSVHTLDLPDANRTQDKYINELAVKENRVVITKDSDFLDSFLVKSIPPKLLLVKTGNVTNKELFMIFEKHIGYMCEALAQSSLVEINRTEIIVH